MDRAGLASFLRSRREAIQPEEVGLLRAGRRRAKGLRREEIAGLCGLSVDYYSRLEQNRGPNPSAQTLGAIARAMRMSVEQRRHLLTLGGVAIPELPPSSRHVPAGLMHIVDSLADTPAQVMNLVGETLIQTAPAMALLGDDSTWTGHRRSHYWRWFVTGEGREIYPEPDHDHHSRMFSSDLRRAHAHESESGPIHALVARLVDASAEFRDRWDDHEVEAGHYRTKRYQHPDLGVLLLHCQVLTDPSAGYLLLVFTAATGSPDYDRFRLLRSLPPRVLVAAH